MQSTKAAGKLLLKRPEGDTATITLQYPKAQADRLRDAADRISFEGRRVPLSLLAKRSADTYLEALELSREHAPDRYAGELRILRGLLTDKPQPAKKTKKTPAA